MRYLLGSDEDGSSGVSVDGAYLEQGEGGRELAPLMSLDPPTLKALISEPVGSKACSVSAAAFASASKRQNQVNYCPKLIFSLKILHIFSMKRGTR